MRASHVPLVKTSVFEGPLDLLLSLIEERKLLINDISLATVTDEYVSRITALGELPLNEASEFVALAATLLLIKSRSLLPSLSLTEEETSDIKELEYRLAMYQVVREGARLIECSLSSPALWEGAPPALAPLFVPDESISLPTLLENLRRLVNNFPKPLVLPKTSVKKVVSLEETIERLASRVSSAIQVSFRDFSKTHGTPLIDPATRYEIVVSFLALLELVKRGSIRVRQEEHFGDIAIEQDSVSTPLY